MFPGSWLSRTTGVHELTATSVSPITDAHRADRRHSETTGTGACDKVKSLSPNHRFVIASHSPDGVVETGLLLCPPEKKVRKLVREVQWDTFSGPV